MPSNWAVCRLEDIAFIGTGATPDTRIDAYYNGNIPWVNSSSTERGYIEAPSSYITEKAISETNCQIYPIGSLVMAMYGEGKTRGQVSELCFDSATNQACAAIVLIDNQMKGFIKAYLKSNYYHIRTLAEGGNQPNLNLTKISQYIIPIPPIEEQMRIVAAVNKWFALISALETAKEDLQTFIAQTKSKILDFAIHGKLVPQDPNDEPAIELLKRINPKFTPCDNAHKRNHIPNSWIWCTLQDSFDITMGSSPTGDTLNRDNHGIEFHQGKVFFSNRYIQPSDIYTTQPIKIAEPQSILLCVRAPVGTINITDHKICIGRGLCSLTPSKSIDLQYAYYVLQTCSEEFEQKATGSTFKAVGGEVVKKQTIPLPPYNEQQRIVNKIEELFAVLDEIQKSIEA